MGNGGREGLQFRCYLSLFNCGKPSTEAKTLARMRETIPETTGQIAEKVRNGTTGEGGGTVRIHRRGENDELACAEGRAGDVFSFQFCESRDVSPRKPRILWVLSRCDGRL